MVTKVYKVSNNTSNKEVQEFYGINYKTLSKDVKKDLNKSCLCTYYVHRWEDSVLINSPLSPNWSTNSVQSK